MSLNAAFALFLRRVTGDNRSHIQVLLRKAAEEANANPGSAGQVLASNGDGTYSWADNAPSTLVWSDYDSTTEDNASGNYGLDRTSLYGLRQGSKQVSLSLIADYVISDISEASSKLANISPGNTVYIMDGGASGSGWTVSSGAGTYFFSYVGVANTLFAVDADGSYNAVPGLGVKDATVGNTWYAREVSGALTWLTNTYTHAERIIPWDFCHFQDLTTRVTSPDGTNLGASTTGNTHQKLFGSTVSGASASEDAEVFIRVPAQYQAGTDIVVSAELRVTADAATAQTYRLGAGVYGTDGAAIDSSTTSATVTDTFTEYTNTIDGTGVAPGDLVRVRIGGTRDDTGGSTSGNFEARNVRVAFTCYGLA